MPKPTIKDLEAQVETLRELRKGDIEYQSWQTREIGLLRDQVKALEADKSWLKNMHSQVLQATHALFRNR